MSTQKDYLITVALDGQPLGVWDTRSGGESDGDIATHNAGDGKEIFPGTKMIGDITITRTYRRERDHELSRQVEKRTAGRGAMSVTEQPLDADGNVWGKPKVWSGYLKSSDTGEADSDSGDRRVWTLVMASQATA